MNLLSTFAFIIVTALSGLIAFVLLNPKFLFQWLISVQRRTERFSIKNVKPKNSNHTFSYIERDHRSSDRPTILFVHGFSAFKEGFLDTSKFIPNEKYHIVAVDLPGHGMTSGDTPKDIGIPYFVQELNKFIHAIGLGGNHKINLVGQSMGGHIVGYYASMYPEDVARVTMVCPHGINFEGAAEQKEEILRTGEHTLLPTTFDEFRVMLANLTHKPIKLASLVLKGMFQSRDEKNVFYVGLLQNLVRSPSDGLLERSLDRILVPSMVVWGELDKILPVSCLETMKEKLPNLQKSVILKDVGHALTLECPKLLAQQLLQFI